MFKMINSLYRQFLFPFRFYIISVLIFIAIVSVLTARDTEEVLLIEDTKILVKTATPQELSGNQTTELIGKVAAKTQVDLQSEVSGRVTGVNVTLGQSVNSGQVIATLENASQRASLISAEGVYEAAQAAAAQSRVGVDEALNNLRATKNRVLSTYKSAYNTNSSIIATNIDPFFSNPTDSIPGLRLDGRGYTSFLNTERIDLRTSVPQWLNKTLSATTEDNLPKLLSEALGETESVLSMVDAFILILQDQKGSSKYTEAEIQTALAGFNSARASLSATLSSLTEVSTALVAAEESLRRAEISGGNQTISSAEAQVKQALGSLKVAEANLAKTIIRTPIAGEVNSLSVKAGDFLSMFGPVAKIANNQGLEITTFIGQGERDLLSVGSELIVEGSGTGTVTNISPAIDSTTGKIEVKVAITNSNLQNGDTVRLLLKSDLATKPTTIQLPLSAIKFDAEQAYVFVVKAGVLERLDVELGAIRGDSVVVTTGLTPSTEVVVDARGKVVGTEVEIIKNN